MLPFTGLAIAARYEARVANYSHTGNGNANQDIRALAQPLQEASSQTSEPEDAFQAQVCVAWIHWMLNDPQAAIEALPSDLSSVITSLSSNEITQWTQVCIIKSAYIKGMQATVR